MVNTTTEITNHQLLWQLNDDQITGLFSEEDVIGIAVESEASSHFSEYAADVFRLTRCSLPHAPATIVVLWIPATRSC